MSTTDDNWAVVGHLEEPLSLKPIFDEFDDDKSFAEFTEAMKRMTMATQTVTFRVNNLTAEFMKLLTGGWVFWWGSGTRPMEPGMVTWDARRRRKRRKR